ncbi:il17rc [Pungitius sinensis]
MSLLLLRAPPPRVFFFFSFSLWLLASAGALETIDPDVPELSCSEGLSDCRVISDSPFGAVPDDAVDVARVRLHVVLGCSAAQECEPYLRIGIAVQDVVGGHEASGDHDPDEEDLFGSNPPAYGSGASVPPKQRALLAVYISSPGAHERRRTLQFKSSHSGLNQASAPRPTHQLLLTVKTMFGTPVVVLVYAAGKHIKRNITIPSLEAVCSMNLKGTEKKCDVPRIRAVIDSEKHVVLQMERAEGASQCWMVQNATGEVLVWPKGKREMVLPSNCVAPCLCLQVWCEGKKLRGEFCPFKNQQDMLEGMQHSVSVLLSQSPVREGGVGLLWNVTAPCRLEAELRLCRQEVAAGGRCEEVTGSRLSLHGGWSASREGLWKAGEFNVSSHPLLCVQIKLHGMKSYLEPQCPFTTSRWRWSLPIFVGLILTSLALLGAYLIRGVLKGYMWRWLKDDDVKGAVGGGHVVLLYLPDDGDDHDQALPELMSHLGSCLQALGFSVSLDLWSRTELSVLGPVPWLHSRLNRLQGQGGKVVLVLTQAAWVRAEEWGARSLERNGDAGDKGDAPPRCGDVFTASLSCVLGDYLQGRAGERFVLVQFKSLLPPGGFRPLPELFRGLHVYSLPSQSLGFLTELAGARRAATASARRKRAGGLRMASRALARRLSGFTAGTTVLRLAGVEDSGETVPLGPLLVTPPSSPDANHKGGDMEAV